MLDVSVICFVASYVLAFVAEWSRLLRPTPARRYAALLLGMAGFAAHNLYLLKRVSVSDLPPLLSSTHDWLLVLAWLGVVFYLFLSVVDRKLVVGMFLLPLVLMLTGSAYFVSQNPNAVVDRDSVMFHWAMLHASLLVFGIGGVLIGIVLSMMYLVQHRRLKHKQSMKQGLMLPSLPRLARLNWWAIMISVPLLTVGMLTGIELIYLSRSNPDPITFADPLVIGSVFIWLAMVLLAAWILTRRRPAGKQVAWLTIWASGFVLITLLGLQVLAGGHAAAQSRRQAPSEQATDPIGLRRLHEKPETIASLSQRRTSTGRNTAGNHARLEHEAKGGPIR